MNFHFEEAGKWTNVVANMENNKVFLGRYRTVGDSCLVQYQTFQYSEVVLSSLEEVCEHLLCRTVEHLGGYND
jgi:hypothetical protein